MATSSLSTPNPGHVPAPVAQSIYIDGLQNCQVRPSEGRGLGIYATCDVLPGTILLSEKPLLVSVELGLCADPVETAFKALTPTKQASYRSLYAYRPRILRESLNRSIMYTNGFQIGPGKNKTAVFLLASRFNHSCVANTHYIWHNAVTEQKINEKGEVVEEVIEEGRMVFQNHYKLLDGEEVTIDYGHEPNALKKFYGFECDCGACTDPGSSPADSIDGESQVEDRALVERNRIAGESELLRQRWTGENLKRRWSLPTDM